MNKPELARKTEILASLPELTPFIDDLPYEMASRAFHNVSFSPEQCMGTPHQHKCNRGIQARYQTHAGKITDQRPHLDISIDI